MILHSLETEESIVDNFDFDISIGITHDVRRCVSKVVQVTTTDCKRCSESKHVKRYCTLSWAVALTAKRFIGNVTAKKKPGTGRIKVVRN